MSDTPFHYRYHSDALSGYMSLSLEERGAYTTILDMIYDYGGPILEQERLIAGYLNVSIRKTRTLLNSLTEKGKLYRTENGELGNNRADKELAKAAIKRRERAENGAKGGYKRAENAKKDKENNGGGQVSPKHQPHTTIHKDTKVSYISVGRFEEFWDIYPHRNGTKSKRKDAFGKYRAAVKSGISEQKIIDAAKLYSEQDEVRRGYGRGPVPWLTQEGWNDELNPNLKAINGGQHGQPNHSGERIQRIVTAAADGTSGKDWG